eukprot:2119463-Rhodomonas_salina.1
MQQHFDSKDSKRSKAFRILRKQEEEDEAGISYEWTEVGSASHADFISSTYDVTFPLFTAAEAPKALSPRREGVRTTAAVARGGLMAAGRREATSHWLALREPR